VEHEHDDRRKYPRLRTDSIVSIRRLGPGSNLGHALDVSLGGIRFQAVGIELDLGEVVRITLTLGTETVEVEGKLVRITDLDPFTQEVALSFTQVDPAVLDVLKDHLPEA
jgi:hypothetical protein